MNGIHRVIGAGGTRTGYAGGVAIQEQLLHLEGAIMVSDPRLAASK